MTSTEEAYRLLAGIPNLRVLAGEPLSKHTRFGLGGPARLMAMTRDAEAFIAAIHVARENGVPHTIIGGGTNLIVADAGYHGLVLKFDADGITFDGDCVRAESGAMLQDLVDFTVHRGLGGLETLAGIPGWVGAAVYGNAGAYGHSISECIRTVRFFNGQGVCVFQNAECEFAYRDSIFKRHKDWIILCADLVMKPAPVEELRRISGDIMRIRNEKFPPGMRCAGSIFKNLLLSDLDPAVRRSVPEPVIREGKVPAAYFLEAVGAKGMTQGGIRVADYHANLIYNTGTGTAQDLCDLIATLKQRVRDRFGLEVEEEVQYVGFDV